MKENNDNRLIRLPEVVELTGIPRSTIYYHLKHNQFPKQVKLSQRSVGWKFAEIMEFINSRQIVS